MNSFHFEERARSKSYACLSIIVSTILSLLNSFMEELDHSITFRSIPRRLGPADSAKELHTELERNLEF